MSKSDLSDLLQRYALDPNDGDLADQVFYEMSRRQLSPKLNEVNSELAILKKEHEDTIKENLELKEDLYSWINDTKQSIFNLIKTKLKNGQIKRDCLEESDLENTVENFFDKNYLEEYQYAIEKYVTDLIDYNAWLQELKEQLDEESY